MFCQTAFDGNNDAAQGSRTTPNYAVTVVQDGQTSSHPVLVVRDDLVKLTCSTDSRDVKSNHSHCAARTHSLVGGTVCALLCNVGNSKRSTSGGHVWVFFDRPKLRNAAKSSMALHAFVSHTDAASSYTILIGLRANMTLFH